MKNRKFKNQKNRARVVGPASTDESLTKEQRVEINSIKYALAVARGLSLMEEHQKKRMMKKKKMRGGGRFDTKGNSQQQNRDGNNHNGRKNMCRIPGHNHEWKDYPNNPKNCNANNRENHANIMDNYANNADDNNNNNN